MINLELYVIREGDTEINDFKIEIIYSLPEELLESGLIGREMRNSGINHRVHDTNIEAVIGTVCTPAKIQAALPSPRQLCQQYFGSILKKKNRCFTIEVNVNILGNCSNSNCLLNCQYQNIPSSTASFNQFHKAGVM